MTVPERKSRYLMLVSVHGRVRGSDMELGVDADTGGQVKYVIELARSLIEHDDVARVDVVTRLISDKRLDPIYSEPYEELAPGAAIIRLRCGPNRYLAKETLWPYLDSLVDNILHYLRTLGQAPDLVHGHYADGGYVASRLAGILNLPMAFTGHSLGRVKRQRLLDKGSKPESIEKKYRFQRRIEAEEMALETAALVIASTNQEVEQQYADYDHYQPDKKRIIPPGVELNRFSAPPGNTRFQPPILDALKPFLRDPGKPMILAMSRPDPRKNLATLIRAYGENQRLRESANLIVVAGTRQDIRDLRREERRVWTELLRLIDLYNLYGQAAYPKEHGNDDVPDLYRLAAKTRGVFVNPALTEPFGLTLLEAAASGVPVVATADGGPQDILALCENGLLVDPLDTDALGEALLEVLSNRRRWGRWSKSGLKGVHRHFAWEAHVSSYLQSVERVLRQTEGREVFDPKYRLLKGDRLLVTDIDNTLTGNQGALRQLIQSLKGAGRPVIFGIATGRSLNLTLKVLNEWKIPRPLILITSVGSAIHYGPKLVRDRGWESQVSYRWNPEALREAVAKLPGLELQPPEGQGKFKISYYADPQRMPEVREIVAQLRRLNLQANVIYSHSAYLDLLPLRASKGTAMRYVATKLNIPLGRCLVAGDSGNDEQMLTGETLGVVVGNHDPELDHLRDEPRVYFAKGKCARGILEGIEHYDFFGKIRIPEEE